MMFRIVRFFILFLSFAMVCNDNKQPHYQCSFNNSDQNNIVTNQGLHAQVNRVSHYEDFLESINANLEKYVLYNVYCLKTYGMDACQTEEFLKLKCQKFKEALLKKDLTDKAILELLGAYRKRNNNRQKYQDLEQEVHAFLNERNRKQVLLQKERAEKAQAQLQQTKKIYALNILYNSDFQSPYQYARQRALEQTE